MYEGKNLYESLYALQDRVRRLQKIIDGALVEIEGIKDGLWKLTGKAATYQLVVDTAKNPPPPKESPSVPEGRPLPPAQEVRDGEPEPVSFDETGQQAFFGTHAGWHDEG